SLNPPPYVDLQAPEVIAPIPEVVAPELAVSTSSPSSTTVDQDAPSSSNSHDVEEDNHDIEVAHMGNDPYFGIPVLEVASGQYSSSDVIHIIVPPDHQVSEYNSKWTKFPHDYNSMNNPYSATMMPFLHQSNLRTTKTH
ncbi:hypothetical protein Tco_0297636, partial [Tanacetum coccineum]